MTLSQLIYSARETGNLFSSCDIPLKLDGKDVEILFVPAGSNQDGWVINVTINKNEID